MARKLAKGELMNAVREKRLVKGVRLNLSLANRGFLSKPRGERGLSMSSYARMASFEQMKSDEEGSK
jgi:hypothetical protein